TFSKVRKDEGRKIGDINNIMTRKEETVTIDGITVPKFFGFLIHQLSIGRLDYLKAKPFQGRKYELRQKLITILQAFNFGKEIVEAIVHVYVDGRTISEACTICKITYQTFSDCIKAVKVFIDFAKSPVS
ncbi:hypothetical protein PENTCL1PPCAC_24950, partial [Pristionchus entomophagus]